MQGPKNRWEVARAAAWLRKHILGASGEERVPPLDEAVVTAAAQAPAGPAAAAGPQDKSKPEPEPEQIDIAGWPALVAPFYD